MTARCRTAFDTVNPGMPPALDLGAQRIRDTADVLRRFHRREGARKATARRVGVSPEEYTRRRAAGERWCYLHRRFEPRERFVPGRRHCIESTRLQQRRTEATMDREVIAMRDLRWRGRLTYRSLSRMFGRSYRAVWAACNGETFRHLPMPGEPR